MLVVMLLGIMTENLSKIEIPLEVTDGLVLQLDEVLTLAVSSSTEAFTNA